MPPRSRTKPGSTARRPKVAGLRQHAHAGAGSGIDDADVSHELDAFDAPVLEPEAPAATGAPATTGAPETPAADEAEVAPTTEPSPASSPTTEVPVAAPSAEESPDDEPAIGEATDTTADTATGTATDTAEPATDTATRPAADDPDLAETRDVPADADGPTADDAKSTTATTATTTATAATTTTKGAGRTRRRAGMAPRAGAAPTTERPGRRADDDAATAAPTRTARPTRTGGRRTEPEAAPQRRFAGARGALSRFAGSRALPITLVVVIVVCLVLAGLAFWQGRKAWTDGPVANQATVDVGGTAELVGQSRESIEKIFSYDFTKLDDSVDAARTMSTGTFTDRYLQVFDQTIRQPAQQQQLRQTATVVNIGVVSMRGDRAEVMALTQFSAQRTTTGQSTNAPGLLRLDMQRVDGRWKLAELTPLTAPR